MTRQNRVLPTGEIVVDPAKGDLMGNRGILHEPDGRLGRARWRHKGWVACSLDFRGRRQSIMAPNHYTQLFFLDEAVALAAGHRPCAECRRADHNAFVATWERAFGARLKAPELDAILHAARVDRATRGQKRHSAKLVDVPTGAFVLWDGSAHLRHGGALLPFSSAGYGRLRSVSEDAEVLVLTPAPTVEVLRAGYSPRLHASAVRPAARPS